MSECSIDKCTNQGRNSQNLCRPHAKEQRATGDLTKTNLTPRMVGDTGATTRDYSPTCSIEGCEKPHATRGWCSMHAKRWRTHGDPLVENRSNLPVKFVADPTVVTNKKGFNGIIDTFLSRKFDQFLQELESFTVAVRKPGIDSDCWEWQGPNQRGYSKICRRRDGKNIAFYGHRMALEATLGRPLHDKMQAHHKCSNTICVNPDHLEESTHNENTAEMKARSYFLARIAELEEALGEINPAHEILVHELPFVA